MCAQKLSALHPRGNEYSHAEHTVMAYWLGEQTEPVSAAVEEACRELGFGEPPLALYTSADAAVAHILLDDVAHDLFWAWANERSRLTGPRPRTCTIGQSLTRLFGCHSLHAMWSWRPQPGLMRMVMLI